MKSVNKINQRRKYKLFIGLIIGIVVLVILIVIIATIVHSKSSDEVEATTITETTTNFSPVYKVVGETNVLNTNGSEETTTLETTTFSNNFIVMPESTTKPKKKRKKQTPTSNPSIVVPNQPEPTSNPYQQSVPNSPQKTTKATPQPTTAKRKATKVPPQYEKGLTSAKRNLIRNCVLENISGNKDTNINNLAIYMANNCISSTSTALNTLNLDTEQSLSSRLATYKIETSGNDNLIDAATNLASQIGSIQCSKYGIGVSCIFSANKYHITTVIVYY